MASLTKIPLAISILIILWSFSSSCSGSKAEQEVLYSKLDQLLTVLKRQDIELYANISTINGKKQLFKLPDTTLMVAQMKAWVPAIDQQNKKIKIINKDTALILLGKPDPETGNVHVRFVKQHSEWKVDAILLAL